MGLLFKTYSKSPIAVASDFGWLSKNSQMVHVIYAENLDWKLLKDSQVHLVCCPSSAIIYDKLADTKNGLKEELTFHVASVVPLRQTIAIYGQK